MTLSTPQTFGLSYPITGPLRVDAALTGWSSPLFATDLDFVNQRMASNGRRRSFSTFMAYGGGSGFSRASAAYDQRLADPLTIDSYATDAARLRGDGLLIGPAATRVSLNPQNPQAWSNSGATLTNLSAAGQWSPVRVASAGQTFHAIQISALSLTSGTPVSMKFLYLAGTSGNARCYAYNTSSTNTSDARGAVGSLAAVSTGAGTITNVTNTALGGGLYLIEFTFTPNGTATHNIGIGPYSATSGQYVDVYGGQVTNTPYPREWILGTAGSTQAIAQDVLKYTAARVGAVASEGALFWVGTPLGFNPLSGTRVLAVGQSNLALSRIELSLGTTGGWNALVYDDTNTLLANISASPSLIGVRSVIGVTWGGGSARARGTGSVASEVSAASPTALTNFSVGSRYDGANSSFSRTERAIVIPRRLSNTEFDATFARLAA